MTTPGSDDSMEGSRLVPAREAITGGFSEGVDFLSYILSGLLIGLLLDWMLSTGPWMTIAWSIAGVAVGFWRMWQRSESLDAEGRERSHGV